MSTQRQERPPAQAARRHRPLLGDIWAGAVAGDFDRGKGLVGTVTQIICGFLPGLGTLCAMRDCVADWRQRDRLGAALNALAFVPLLGGFPKAVDALHSAHQIGRIIHATRQPDATGDDQRRDVQRR